jgi:predicted RNA-binding protein (virulence factor B family)
MADLGKYNLLRVAKTVDFGVYLDAGQLGEVLLPKRYIAEALNANDWVEVFLYNDSEDRYIATTESPIATVGEFANLRVVDTNEHGAFLDWGLPKDLFVPLREQRQKMEMGKHYFVYIYVDEESDRIVASAKTNKFVPGDVSDFEPGQQVKVVVAHRSDLGYNVIVENRCWGMLYDTETFQRLRAGEQRTAFVKKVREDGKLDLSLQRQGVEAIEDFSNTLFQALEEAGGFLPFTDKSSADEIYENFGVSKKIFKKAVGRLYKERVIAIEDSGIRLA